MRRGMTLVELLVTIPMITAVSVVMAAFFPGVLRDTPRIQRATHVHRGLTHVLRTPSGRGGVLRGERREDRPQGTVVRSG